MITKIIYKDTFAVIGKAGQGRAENPQEWILPLWEEANADFIEIADIIRKNASGTPLIWGAMNDVSEQNKRWDTQGKYMAGGEAGLDVVPPEGWTKWVIPAQTYMVVECRSHQYAQVFGEITSDPNIQISGTVHERYPEPGNPEHLELWFPIFAQGREAEILSTNVKALNQIEAEHPGLVSRPLLSHIQGWLALGEGQKTEAKELDDLRGALLDGQDCDLTGTPWEEEWLAAGRVCYCPACEMARQCISDIGRIRV